MDPSRGPGAVTADLSGRVIAAAARGVPVRPVSQSYM